MNYKISDFEEELKTLEQDVFVHGCNTKGLFSAGIAGIVRKVYPECHETYMSALRSYEFLAGDIIPHEIKEGKVILNALTQVYAGRNGSYDLIDKVFFKVALVYGDNKICFPLIGCGIAGLEWEIVSSIIDFHLKNLDYVCMVREEDIKSYNLNIK